MRTHRTGRSASVCFALSIGLGAIGCTSAREKDCKALAALREEAKLATDALTPERPGAASKSLRAVSLADDAMREPVERLASALDREAIALTEIGAVPQRLQIAATSGVPGGDAGVIALLEPVTSIQSHAERLLQRCGFPLPTLEQIARPECTTFASVLRRCLDPAPNVALDALVARCADDIAVIGTEDAPTRESIGAIAKALRGAAPLMKNIHASAAEALAVAKDMPRMMEAVNAARAQSTRAQEEIAGLCSASK